jgi:pyruvate carboxylase
LQQLSGLSDGAATEDQNAGRLIVELPQEQDRREKLLKFCGKVAVKQVAFIHDGKFDEANKLSTKEMQDQWKAMPAKDKTEMSGLAKAMSPTQEQFTAQVKAGGVLVVDAGSATLTTKTTTKDANGSSTETTTQKFKLDGGECLVSR